MKNCLLTEYLVVLSLLCLVTMASRDAYMILILILVLVPLYSSSVLSADHKSRRKVSLRHNPECNISQCNSTSNTSIHIIYARAEGSNDTLHYVLSTVGSSPPTVLLLKTSDVSAELKINWTKLLFSPLENVTGSVQLVSRDGEMPVGAEVENVLIFDRVLEYNDSSDSVTINKTDAFSPILLSDISWDVNVSSSHLSAVFVGTSQKYPHTFDGNSSITFSFSPFGNEGQSLDLPALPHTSNSSDWTFNLNQLLSRGNGSRFSVELLMLGKKSAVRKTRIKSINDEYCPAVFTTEKMEWTVQNEDGADLRTETFAQWRAVSYTDTPHQRKYSTDVKASILTDVNVTSPEYKHDLLENRLLAAYFGLEKVIVLNVTSTVVSFGEPGDGFYAATKYMSWTSSVGFGSPPVDSFSTLVICMLFAGVGCPLLVILVGGVYLLIRRISRRKKALQKLVNTNYDYQPIS